MLTAAKVMRQRREREREHQDVSNQSHTGLLRCRLRTRCAGERARVCVCPSVREGERKRESGCFSRARHASYGPPVFSGIYYVMSARQGVSLCKGSTRVRVKLGLRIRAREAPFSDDSRNDVGNKTAVTGVAGGVRVVAFFLLFLAGRVDRRGPFKVRLGCLDKEVGAGIRRHEWNTARGPCLVQLLLTGPRHEFDRRGAGGM
ncbi:hypothetical protein LY76DRAFT_410729 [Colletotrichum caudatum]|nr:hypothetical protein LY76DRAFT_410729 [Colletotrichum caudatum]